MTLYSAITLDHDLPRNKARAKAYRAYLQSVAEYLPPATKDFALGDWYYADPDRCPHDAWVESVESAQEASGQRMEIREAMICVRLLASSHRGQIYFRYAGVTNYELNSGNILSQQTRLGRGMKHEDWLADQITLGERGEVEHEILFRSGVVWRIRAKGISHEYKAFGEETPVPQGLSFE